MEDGNGQDPSEVAAQLRALTSDTSWDAVCVVAERAAAALERVAGDDDEATMLLGRQSMLLHAVADALHGGPLDGGLWSWHDLPERAAAAIGELEQLHAMIEHLRSALKELDAAKDAEIAAVRTELETQRALAESACAAHDAVVSELFFAAEQNGERLS